MIEARPPTVRPKAIDSAFLFALAGILLGAIGTVLTTLMDHERIVRLSRDALSRSGQPYTDADVLAMMGPMRIAAGIAIAVVVALLVLVALRARAGRNWARLLLTGLALIGMFDFTSSVAAEGAALELIWNLAGVAFLVAAVIYLFRPESTKYFAERR